VIVVVLVVVVGPKELPGVLRTFGTWMAKARSLSREFQNNMNQLAREVDREKVKVATPPPPKATAVEPDPTGAAPSAAGDKAKVEATSAETATTDPNATAETATTVPNIAGTSAAKLAPGPAATEAASEIPATPEDELKAAANTGAAKDDEEAATILASEGSTWATPGPPPNPGILTATPPADLTASGDVASKSNGSGSVNDAGGADDSGRAKDSAVDEPALAASPSSVGER